MSLDEEPKCPRCDNPAETPEEGVWCEECQLLYYPCDECEEPCEFVGVIGYQDTFDETDLVPYELEEKLTANEVKDSPLCISLKDPNGMLFYAPYAPITILDLENAKGADCCAYRWKCNNCDLSYWTNPD